jgi:nucleoside-diphosphate-sugar epimerase
MAVFRDGRAPPIRGNTLIDWIHIDDVIDAFIVASSALAAV